MKLDDRPSGFWNAVRTAAVSNAGNGSTAYASSDRRLIELFGGMPSASGIHVTAESSMRVAAVYACVNRIAGGIATLPCNVYAREWDPERQRFTRRLVDDAPLWWLLNEQPCAAWTGAAHWERAMEYSLLRGDAFTWIRRKPSGAINEFVPLPWDAVRSERLTLDAGSRLMYAVADGYRNRGVDQDDMLHFPGFGFDGVRGRSVISHAAHNATGNALAMDTYSGKVFAGGANPSIILKTDKKMSPELVGQLQAEVVKKYASLQNAHNLPMVLTEGMSAEKISLTPEDAQLLDARKFQVIDIARAFGVPPHMIGETSASTSWGSGIESMGRAFVQYTLAAHLKRLEQELNRKLFRTARLFVEFDRSALVEGDLAAQAAYFRAALGGPGSGKGWMSVNDVRNRKNLPPVAGEDGIYTPPDKAPAQPGTEPQKAAP